MKVAGHIRNGLQEGEQPPYVYMVAVNPTVELPTVQGPISVIGAPWGNGMVEGNATHFIRYFIGFQPYPYTVYRFPTPDLLFPVAVGTPVSTLDPGTNGDTIQFEIDLSQVLPSGVTDPNTLNYMQLNFLTMNRIPAPNDTGSKIWDALGDGRDPNGVNEFIRIPLNASRIWTNTDFQDIEVQGDCVDPNLDIVSWSVEVRKP
jgi:hypothetical protein